MFEICHDSGFSHAVWFVCDRCSVERKTAAFNVNAFRQRFVVGAAWDGSTEDGYWL